jgi:hypothetical protein
MQRTHAKFRKLPGVEDANNARSEDEAAADAVADKIARLKELRLARDAAARAAPPPARVKKGRDKKKQKKRPAVALADWLKSRHAAS